MTAVNGQAPSAPATRKRTSRSTARKLLAIVGRIALFVLGAVFAVPLYLLIAISLKSPQQTAESPFSLPLPADFSNYTTAWQHSAGSGSASFAGSLLNSALITGLSVLLIVGVGSAAGYYLGRRRTRLSRRVYMLFLAGITLPVQLAVIPLYGIFDTMGLLGSPAAVVAFYVGLLTPFSVFLFTGFVRSIPIDFEEAAQIDGAGWIQMYFRIILPLLGPVVSTVAVLTSIAVWNDFFSQLVFLLGSGNETLPLTVYTFSGQYTSQYNLLTAGLVIAAAPIVVFYLLLQRRIVEGFSTGVKG